MGYTFDFETQPSYTITFSVKDDVESALASKVLSINVLDVNEPPVVTPKTLYITTQEAVVG